MTAEEIIRSNTETLKERRIELIEMYRLGNDKEADYHGDYLLEETVLIEMELMNRGLGIDWTRNKIGGYI